MKLFAIITCGAVMLFTVACQELAAQRRYDKSMAMDTPVQANGISALTPEDHLLFRKQKPAGFRLDDPDGFIVYTVQHATRGEFDAMVAQDRKNSVQFETLSVESRGGPLTVHFAKYDKEPMEYLTYFTYFGPDDDGIIAEHTHTYFKNPSQAGAWRPDVPREFVRFVNSVKFVPAGASHVHSP